MAIVKDKIDTLSSLISPRVDIAKPIYNWHSFKHSYSKGLVDNLIKDYSKYQPDLIISFGNRIVLDSKILNLNTYNIAIIIADIAHVKIITLVLLLNIFVIKFII